MDAIRVNALNKVGRVSSKAHNVCSDSNLAGFFIRDKEMATHPNDKIYGKRYRESEKGRATQKRHQIKCRKLYPERTKAYDAVAQAIITRKIPRANVHKCYYCPNQAEDYHHYFSYEPEDWFKIRPVCRKCHKKIHRRKTAKALENYICDRQASKEFEQ